MVNYFNRALVIALAIMVMSSLNGIGAVSDTITVSNMQLRATVAGMTSSAAYLKIINNGMSDDRLIAAKSAIALCACQCSLASVFMRMMSVPKTSKASMPETARAAPIK